MNEYKIGDKTFTLKDDFTYAELEWIDVVYDRLQVGGGEPEAHAPLAQRSEAGSQNEIKGSFTKDEIERTLKILLVSQSPFTHEDFLNTRESLSVKIIADFFLMKAVLGAIIKSSLMN